MKTYYEKLKDPRWQKKRLEVMDRDGFECQNCGATDKTLNVHHRAYLRGFEPWEYPDDSLETLCEDCHKEASKKIERLNAMMAQTTCCEIDCLIGFLKGVASDDAGVFLDNYEECAGFVAQRLMQRQCRYVDKIIKRQIEIKEPISGREADVLIEGGVL